MVMRCLSEFCIASLGSLLLLTVVGCDSGASSGGDAGVAQLPGIGGDVAFGSNTGASTAQGGNSSVDNSGGVTSILVTGGSSNTDSAGGVAATGGMTANSTATAVNIGGVAATGGAAATGGKVATGGAAATGGVKPTGGAPATGGTRATTSTTSTVGNCSTLSLPTSSSTEGLSVASNGYAESYYSTAAGFAYTWVGADSITPATCVTPTCTSSGCSPSFGSNAVCAAGYVAGDSTFSSVVGFGFNLSQTNVEGSAASLVEAPSYLTFYYTKSGTGQLRLQVTDGTTSWCYDTKGTNYSSIAIPIVSFNTKCWDDSGDSLSSGTPIQNVELIIPSEKSTTVNFSNCLIDVEPG